MINAVAAGEEIADFVTGFVPFEQPKQIVRSTVKYSTSVTSKVVMGIPSATSAVVSSAAALPGASLNAISSGAGLALRAPGKVLTAISSLWAKTEMEKVPEIVEKQLEADTFTDPTFETAQENNETQQSSVLQYLNPLNYVINPFDYLPSFSKSNERQPLVEESSSDKDSQDSSSVTSDVYSSTELLPIPQDSDWTPWISLGLTTVAMAGGTYFYAGSLLAVSTTTVVKRVALAYALSHADNARQRLRFLYPIWGESHQELESRVHAMKKETECNTFLFKCYYHNVKSNNENGDELTRTFIKVPTDHQFDRYFVPVGTSSSNEIAGHSNMFSRSENPGYYWDIIHRTSFDVKKILRKLKLAQTKL